MKPTLLLLTALLLTGCLPLRRAPRGTHSRVDSVFVQRLVPGPVPVPPDTSLMRALLRCNAEGRIAMERLSIATTRNARLAFLLDSLGELRVETIVRHDTIWARADSVFITRDVVREVIREVERKKTHWEAFTERFGVGAFWVCVGAAVCGAGYGVFRLYRRRLPI